MTECLGRSSWTTRGLGSSATAPNYTLLTPNIGSAYVSGLNRSGDYQAVWYGVREIQRALSRRSHNPGPADGWFGPRTALAVRAFKKTVGRPDNPKVGNLTARVLFAPDVEAAAGNVAGVAAELLCGIVTKESSWDPGAVGCLTPDDLGLCQVNTKAHAASVSREQAFDAVFALGWTARRLADAARAYDSMTFPRKITRDQYVAASHNWPAGASTWVRSGLAPTNTVSGETLADYVAAIQAACS